MDGAARFRARRQGHVDAFGGEPRVERFIGQLRLARGDGVRHAVAQAVEERAIGLARVGAHAAERFQKLADAALLAQRGDAHGVQRGLVAGVCDRIENGGFEGLDVVHG